MPVSARGEGMLSMKMSRCAQLVLVLLAFGQAIAVHAQGEDDLKIARIRQEHPEGGFVFFDITLMSAGRQFCAPKRADLVTDNWPGSAAAHFEIYRPNPLFSFDAFSRGTMMALRPGVYTITKIYCDNRKAILNGKFAQIRVEPGEVINAGNLILEVSVQQRPTFFTDGTAGITAKIGELSPDTVAALRTRAPESFGHAKRQLLTAARP
jgi:hypothetical protein